MLVGPGAARRRGRRRGLIVGAAVGSSMARRNAQNAAEDQAAPQDSADNAGVEQQLTQLQDLHAKGLITQEEFDAKRKQLLGL